jgi:NADPH2:quinone reductase
MKSIVINKFGEAAEVFENLRQDIPVPKEGQVLINVLATSINPIDIHLRKGSMPALVPAFPAVLHGDVAGIVEATGLNAGDFKRGDFVFGWVGGLGESGGALAELLVADHRVLAKAPKRISYKEAAAVPLVALTAYEAIFERANVQPGQKVLVYGGVGGVGHMGVQFAKLAGAQVYAVVSNDNDIVRALSFGADHAVNYNKESTEEFVHKFTNGAGFDVVFDTVGNQNLANSFQTVKPYGVVVTTIALTEVDLTPIHLKAASFHVVFLVIPIAADIHDLKTRFGANLKVIADWIEQGKLKVHVDPVEFNFDHVVAAHEYFESGKSKGKVVISK